MVEGGLCFLLESPLDLSVTTSKNPECSLKLYQSFQATYHTVSSKCQNVNNFHFVGKSRIDY